VAFAVILKKLFVCCTIGISLRRREIYDIFKKRPEEGHCHNLTRHHFDGKSKLHSFFHLIGIQFVFVPAKFKGAIMKALIAVLRLHFPTQSSKNCHRSTKAKTY
jgi:hypothetical protein